MHQSLGSGKGQLPLKGENLGDGQAQKGDRRKRTKGGKEKDRKIRKATSSWLGWRSEEWGLKSAIAVGNTTVNASSCG